MCSSDPLIFNEIGVVCYNEGKYESAIEAFRYSIALCTDNAEAVLANLGHSYRKLLRFTEAVECYRKASVLCPQNTSNLVSLGFTKHLQGNIDEAIEIYHKALAMKPNHSFASRMLSRALMTSVEISTIDSIPMRKVSQESKSFDESINVSSSYIEASDQSNMMMDDEEGESSMFDGEDVDMDEADY